MNDMESAKPNSTRKYKVWKGNNRFLFGGRLIFGPDAASLLLSMFLIAAPSILFCYQIVRKIVKDKEYDSIQNEFDDHIHVLNFTALTTTIIIMTSDLIFLLLTSSRDPGIIPRNTNPPDSEDTFGVTTPSMEWISGRTPHLRLPRTKDVTVNGFTVKVKYCDTCMLYRPPRASHCSICNNCVQKFDHHCPWVGQCIGIRNYRFFFLFILTSTVLCVYVFTLSLLNILKERREHQYSLWKSVKKEVISLILIIYTFLTVWFVGGLTIFHTYLISTNQTTYENFRYRYDKKDNPYAKGIFGNFIDVFFSRIPPSMNDFRAWVFVEDMMETGCFTPNIETPVRSLKEKVDIEMGSKLQSGDHSSIPAILQNLDYTAVDCEELNEKSLAETDEANPFTEPNIDGKTQVNYIGDRQTVDGREEDHELKHSSSSSDDDDHHHNIGLTMKT